MSAMDFAQLERVSRHRLQERALTELELVIVHRVLDYSYALGVTKARFKRLQFLCAVCGHGKNKISPALSRVESYEIVRVDRVNWVIEFCADPARWLVPLRVRPALRAQAANVDAWLRRINAPGMEEQPELWPDEPTLDDALYEVYRETAIDWNDPGAIRAKISQSLGSSSEPDDEVGHGRLVPQKGTPDDAYCSPKGNSEGGVSQVVPQKGTAPIGIGHSKECLLPVQETGQRSAGNSNQTGLQEQIERLERVISVGNIPWLNWWRKHAGRSAQHTIALRQSLDDLSTNRKTVRDPSRWLVKTFKNKCRLLRHFLFL